MHGSPLSGALYKRMEKQGFKGKIVSIAHVKELQKEIETLRKKGLLDRELYDTYLASFDFECQRAFSGARSLIIVCVPQPQVRVVFKWENHSFPAIIPPTYSLSTDQQVADLLDSFFSSTKYHFKKVRLPEKLLAVRSGLAQYGSNNISYVPDMGSFYRPVVYISNFPCPADSWGKAAVLKFCETCNACLNACPTRAISSDRFQLYAERCLTFFNESTRDFPDWLSPAWHNSLMGCMICQKVCPANKDVVRWTETAATFDSEDTDLILNGVSKERLTRKTLEKLNKLGMTEYYNVLGRNLRFLIEQQAP